MTMTKDLSKWVWRLGWRVKAARAGGLEPQDIFPDFSLNDITGKPRRLSDPSAADFTALWFTNLCEDCQSRIPLLEELRLEAGDRFRILAVSLLGADTTLPRQVATRCGFPILPDPRDIVASELGLPHPPQTCPLHNLYILDRSRRILFRHHLSALKPEAFRSLWRGYLRADPGSQVGQPPSGAPVPQSDARIVLFRCGCRHCDAAEEELRRLAGKRGAALEIKRVEQEGLERLAGWSTPVVCINGVQISRFSVSPAKWEKALASPLVRQRLTGEIVDLSCYEKSHARGEEHRECAELCVQEIGLPVGLLAADGRVYRLAAGRKGAGAYELLKETIGRKMEISGDVFEWEGQSAFLVEEAR